MFGKEGARSLLRAGTAASRGDHTLMTLLARDAALTEMEGDRITRNTAGSRAVAMARVVVGGRLGWACTSDVTAAGVRTLAEEAYQAALRGDPAGSLPGSTLGAAAMAAAAGVEAGAGSPPARRAYNAFSTFTARQVTEDPRARADDLATVSARARRKGLVSWGGYSTAALEMAVAATSIRGTHGPSFDDYHSATRVGVWARVSDGPSVGQACAYSQDARDIDITILAEQAIARCQAARGHPLSLASGKYDVVLEPAAVRRLVLPLGRLALAAPPAYSNGVDFSGLPGGPVVASPLVTLVDDPTDPWGAPQPFEFDGAAKERLVLIDRGIARHAISDTPRSHDPGLRVARHAVAWPGEEPALRHLTLLPGGAGDLAAAHGRAGIGTPTSPGDLFLSAGVADLVAKVGRGLLITRLGPLQVVDPRAALMAGHTQGAVFLIEGGRPVQPVTGMFFRQSLWDLLARVRAVGEVAHLFLGSAADPAGDPVDNPAGDLFSLANYAGGRFPALLVEGMSLENTP